MVWIQDLPRKVQKASMVRHIDVIGRACFLCFLGSLFFFLFGFALFGVSKFNPTKTQPLVMCTLPPPLLCRTSSLLTHRRVKLSWFHPVPRL